MSPASYQLPDQNFSDKKSPQIFSEGFGSGSRTRTYDLRVMSPTSYQLLHPALFFVIYITAITSEMFVPILKKANCARFKLDCKDIIRSFAVQIIFIYFFHVAQSRFRKHYW